jgi:integrase
MPKSTFPSQFHRLLRGMGLPHMHFHDLCHSAASILLSMGVPAHVVQELLGHSDVATTLGIYGHVVSSVRKDVVDKLAGLYGPQS